MSSPDLVIRAPDDFHVHLRDGELLEMVFPSIAAHSRRVLVMPNLSSPILTAADALAYRLRIMRVAARYGMPDFQPIMSLYLTDETLPEEIARAKQAGIFVAKAYPKGREITTGAEQGVSDWGAPRLRETLSAMQELRMVLSVHGEVPDPTIDCLDREARFLPILSSLVRDFPRLQIVFEHATTAEAVEAILRMPATVAATITAHHLWITLNEVIGGKLTPHNFCKPVAKRFADREALIRAVTSGNPKFFMGTDIAPHRKRDKECALGCAGVFTAPHAILLYATIFERAGKLDRLEGFTSSFGADFYGLPRELRAIGLVRQTMRVPEMIGEIVPFMALAELPWTLLP